jgi:hypothetical protein
MVTPIPIFLQTQFPKFQTSNRRHLTGNSALRSGAPIYVKE